MNTIKTRIEDFKKVLSQKNIDFYIVPTADFHNSEYVSDYFKVREYLSGFTGSNGTLVISKDETGLWTDGRYFVQADKELEGLGVVLYKMGEEGVPTIEEYLSENVKEGQTIGFDGRVVDASFGIKLENLFADRKVRFAYDSDLVNEIWTDRPSLPASKIWTIDEKNSGQSVSEKLEIIRNKMKDNKTLHLLISKLDDIMWLYNIRAADVECNPVALSYTFVSEDNAVLFVQGQALTEETAAYFIKNGLIIKEYDEIKSYLENYEYKGNVWCSLKDINYLLYKTVKKRLECLSVSDKPVHGKIYDHENPTTVLKAVKNPVELKNIRECYLKDSVVLTKFLFWMKQNVGKVKMDEISVAKKLDEMRSEIDGFLELSFPTISAYKENAAMAHYSATEEEKKEIQAEGLYLVDSGGQYVNGTTDVTRTIALGEVTEEEKKHFTKVACAMLRLGDTRFLHGCTGRNIDIIARQPLWECYIDYKHGTGHGIGYILNVHEGPQNIRWRFAEGTNDAVLEEGMIVSDEPGVYIEGSHGIRTENIVEVVKENKNEYGQFMRFRFLTYVPIDLDVIDTRYMEDSDIRRLNKYHEQVYNKLEPYFEGQELEMLKYYTRKVL